MPNRNTQWDCKPHLLAQHRKALSNRPRRLRGARWGVWPLAALLFLAGSAIPLRAAEEFRAAWADVFHVGMSSSTEVDTMVSTLVSGRYNAVVVQVLAYMDRNGYASHGAHWKSSILPWSTRVTSSFDPLAYLCTKAHANGIQVHAWLGGSGGGPYRVSTAWPPPNNATLTAHPEWFIAPYASSEDGAPVLVDGNYSLDMGSPDVQEYIVSIVKELVTNYPIDGINWDDELNSSGYNEGFGYPAYSQASYARSGLARFRINTGYSGTPGNTQTAWSNYRRRFKNELMARVQAEIQSIKTNPRQPLRHTIAPIAYSPVPSSCTFSGSAPYTYFCDWAGMLQNGYVDAAMPQTYSSSTFNTWADRCANCWQYNRQIFSGIGAYLYGNATIASEISSLRSKGLKGYCTYSYAASSTDGGWWAYAAANVNTSTATIPSMPWRNPATATEGIVWGRVTDANTGLYVDDATVTVTDGPTVKTDGNGYYIATLVPATASGTAHSTTVSKTGMTSQTVTAIALAGDVVRYDLVLNAAVGTAPTITTQPLSQTVNQGTSVTFTVAATGTTPFTYQWRFNGANISGATLSSYTKSSAQATDAGSYSVVVANGAGSATSANAVLTVIVPPTITTQPLSQTVNQGTIATFTVAASGTAPFTYQWRFNGANISGATLSSYTLNSAQPTDAGSYSVLVANAAGSATSSSAVLTVIVPPTITTQPLSQTVTQGTSATFTVAASGTTPFTYQWRFNGANISGATLSSYTKSSAQPTDAGSYSVLVANAAGSAASANAILTVQTLPTAPTITTHPQSLGVVQGASATFTVTASGTAPLYYQWRFYGTNLAGATTSSYTRADVQPADAGPYSVIVSNSVGVATSSDAVLSLVVPPTITTHPSSQSVTPGASVTFSVVAAGTAPLNYQWRKNGANISGATTSSYTLSNVQTGDAGSYAAFVSNAAGSATSANGVLVVLVSPAITAQPLSQTVTQGQNATFTVTASGTTPLAYQWRLYGTNIAGATTSSYTRSNLQLADAGPYSVIVSNGAGTVTSSDAVLTVLAPPAITTQPLSQTITQGLSATFTVAASGSAPLTYQWRFNGANISGATASSYTRANVQPADAGSYTVVVANTVGSATSANAILTVYVPLTAPSIVTQPQDQTVGEGASATFTVSASGSTPLYYQWRLNGVNISGATTSSYTLSSVQLADAGPYSVIVSNSMGAATSANALLTVIVPPAITTQPISQTVTQGQSVTFSAVASGTAPLTYQWRLNGASISGATASRYTRVNVQPADAGSYSVFISNSGGNATSANAVLTVLVPPAITTQPISQTVTQGSSATFTVAASGTTPLAYQWRLNGASISGATASSYTRANVQTTDAGSYSVQVSNSAGSATSANAVLTVTVPPTITTQPISRTVAQGSSVTFTVAASGTTPLTYQWRLNGASISGATASSYTRANVQATDAGSYSVLVSNSAGSATSANAVLTVTVPPTITTQPISQTVNQGDSAVFTVAASGSTPLAYQWRWYGTNLAGATGTSLALTGLTTNQSGPYTVVVTNAYGAVTSQVATLTVSPVLQAGGLSVLWKLAPGSRSYLTSVAGAPPDERGMAYNPLTRRVIIVQRTTMTAYVLDGDTGADLWTLNTTGVTGGYAASYYLLMVGVAEDGAVYAGNMTLHGNTVDFKVYRWANDSYGTLPTVAYSGDPGEGLDLRWGDSFDVRGAGANTQIIIGSLNGNQFAVLTTTDGVNFTSQPVTLSDATSAVGVGLAFGAGDTFWCKAGLPSSQDLRQASFSLAAGTAATARDYADPVFPGSIGPIGVNPGLNVLGGVNVAAAGAGNSFQLYDLTTTNGAPVSITATNFATDNDNSYAGTGAVDFGGDRVYALSSNNGLLAMQIVPKTIVTPPAIITHPASQTVDQGASATFSVVATGTAPLSYQWRFNGAAISGATGSSYTRANVQTTDAGSYSVFISNSAGSATSANAVLAVSVPAAPPAIASGPQSQTIIAGQNATFTVVASGTAPLSYQWRFNGANISGATANSYTRPNVQTGDAGAYSVVVSNDYGTVTSSAATLTVHFSLTATAATGGTVSRSPDQSSYAPGTSVTLTATPSGSYEFAGWSGDASGTANPITVVVNGNLAVTANFTVTCDIILDNTDSEVTYSGAWQTGTYTGLYGTDYRFALGSTTGNSNVTYRPNLCGPGYYDVYIWYVTGGNRATNAPWQIVYSGGSTNVRVNQKINGSQWWRLAASLPFDQGTSGYVRVYNTNASSGGGSTVIIADAVRFTYVAPLTAASITTLASSANPSGYGNAVTLTATVTGSGGTPGGTVTFKDGAAVLGTATLNGSGQATFTTSTLSASGSPHSLTAVYGGDGSFSSSSSSALSQVVNPKALTVTGAAVTSKVYDGTTAATITGAALSGVVSGDAVTLGNATSGTFANKNVGAGKAVATAMTLSGANSGNYTLTQPTLTGTITAKALTVTGAAVTSKVYDGTTAATITGAALSGVVSGDAVTLGNATSGTFANKNVGAGKAVATAMTLSGANSGNYTLTQPTLTGTITAKALTVTGLTAQNKTYDGTTVATIAGAPVLAGVVSGDAVALAGTAAGAFADANVGTAKPVAISGLSLTGADAGNYSLTAPTAAANITGAATVTTLASSVNPSGPGSNVIFTVTVASGAGTPAGEVVFLAGGTPFSTNSLTGGAAQASTSSLALGTNAIRAEYAGGGNFLGSSTSLDQVVKAFLICGQASSPLSIVKNPDGTFTLTFAGTPQADYYVVGSPDVTLPAGDWLPVPGSTNTVTDAGGMWHFTVTNKVSQQFYRGATVAPCP